MDQDAANARLALVLKSAALSFGPTCLLQNPASHLLGETHAVSWSAAWDMLILAMDPQRRDFHDSNCARSAAGRLVRDRCYAGQATAGLGRTDDRCSPGPV